MLREISLQNYRSFARETRVELRPLTLFFGYNNAGKSALLRALVLAARSLRGEPGRPLRLDPILTRDASFAELTGEGLFGAAPRMQLGIRLEHHALVAGDWWITDLGDGRPPVVESCTFTPAGDAPISATIRLDERTLGPISADYEITRAGDHQTSTLFFQGLLPHAVSKPPGRLARQLSEAAASLFEPEISVQWLTATRRAPPRLKRIVGPWVDALGFDGEGAIDVLATESRGGVLGPIGAEVSHWYEKHTGRRLEPRWMTDQFSLQTGLVAPEGEAVGPAAIHLVDAGEGLIQVLPILVALARARQRVLYGPRLLCFEEPESHLHPRLHAALAEKMCETIVGDDPPTVVVETHSEVLLLRVQRAIADGLSPDKVMIYWVYQTENGESWINRVTFDEFGRPIGNWPSMVFAEDSRQARELLVKQRELIGNRG